jgi:sulfonate transport system substrate-binding protein
MAVALETNGVDAIAAWDPWPITVRESVEGAYDVVRGGGYIAYIGYIVSTREYVENNPETVEALLTARAAADHWMRQNPAEAGGGGRAGGAGRGRAGPAGAVPPRPRAATLAC